MCSFVTSANTPPHRPNRLAGDCPSVSRRDIVTQVRYLLLRLLLPSSLAREADQARVRCCHAISTASRARPLHLYPLSIPNRLYPFFASAKWPTLAITTTVITSSLPLLATHSHQHYPRSPPSHLAHRCQSLTLCPTPCDSSTLKPTARRCCFVRYRLSAHSCGSTWTIAQRCNTSARASDCVGCTTPSH